jgi:hypothetical protein
MVLAQMPIFAQIESGDLSNFGASFLAFFALALAAGLFSGVAYFVISVASMDALTGRKTSFWGSLAAIFTWRVFKTLLLQALALLGGLLLCFVGILVVAPLLALVIPVMTEEKLYGRAALKRSYELVAYSPTERWVDSGFFLVCGLSLVWYALTSALTSITQLPLMVAQFYLSWRHGLSGETPDPMALMNQLIWIQAPCQAASALIQVCIWLFMTFGSGILFFHLRRRKEGEDLKLAVRELREAALA